MIKKSLIVLALSTSIISSAVYASERFGPSERPGPSKVKITLGDVNKPVMGRYFDNGNINKFTLGNIIKILNNSKSDPEALFQSFLSNLNNGRDAAIPNMS